MQKSLQEISSANQVICENISNINSENRLFYSKNICGHIRHLIDHIAEYLYLLDNNVTRDIATYDDIKNAHIYMASQGKYRLLNRLHKWLQISVSHYTPSGDNAERLILKYYTDLVDLKKFMSTYYGINILDNLEDYPLDTDRTLQEYYSKIVEKIPLPRFPYSSTRYNNTYYIKKIKAFFINSECYYEVTFVVANEAAGKFDRLIAFTKHKILPNYAVKFKIREENITLLEKTVPILIIDDWHVSIRACEFKNFAKILNIGVSIPIRSKESIHFMRFLTKYQYTLAELAQLPEDRYVKMKALINSECNCSQIFSILDKCHELILSNSSGKNILSYLLHTFNNAIIKKQYSDVSCNKLSDLYLQFGCIPFDKMPYNTSPINHNPRFFDLIESIPIDGKEHEMLARYIKNNTEEKGCLYTNKKDLVDFENVDTLINAYNTRLYSSDKHQKRRLEEYNNHIYIKGYEDDVFDIIQKLKSFSDSGMQNYTHFASAWLADPNCGVDCPEKEDALLKLFENSKVSLIYGSAGTGKSTLINHISSLFNDNDKIYLANTNTAVDNLRRKIKSSNTDFMTITKFLSGYNRNISCDILFIDECSTVSNIDMLDVLNKATFKAIVLVGDIFQIESIIFGNWFTIIKSFIPATSIFELTKKYRSKNPALLTLWDRVRDIEDNILECITHNHYSHPLDSSIFENHLEDEVILCLNYDGIYGINNINRFLQAANPNQYKYWDSNAYKVNDPILFNDTNRLGNEIHNNLKGVIKFIEIKDDKIWFDVELEKIVTEFGLDGDTVIVKTDNQNQSTIRFSVNKYKTESEEGDDDEDSLDTVVPFQISYAISIHKAQGLEYESVKIVITDEVEEMISHNIFYTAITRTKNKLKIYWPPETERKILSKFEKKNNAKDIMFLKQHKNIV